MLIRVNSWLKFFLAAFAVIITARLALLPFREGWTQMRTDFPNHYVAARLALDRAPLRQWYDWEFFERNIAQAGIDRLGSYSPYPPLTLLPLLPIARLPPQQAKQVWLIFELACLAASVLLLARLMKIGILPTLALALAAYASLATNFRLGHYYIFLLLLLSAAVWSLQRGRDLAAGALFGLIFALKLYAAPFALFFAMRRQWRALLGMAGTILLLTAATVAIFGWDGVHYFATTVMTRGGDGEIVDPYSPAFGSMSVILHRLFIAEPGLNPHPWLASPPAFFFLQMFYTAGLTVFCLLALPPKSPASDAHAAALWIVLLFALSPITAFSHFVMLLVPVVLLLPDASPRWAAGLIALYVLVQFPERNFDAWLFPRLWFTLALLLYVGWPFFRAIPPRTAMLALAGVSALSLAAAITRTPPHLGAEPIEVRPAALLSSAPALGSAGIVYESMEATRFALRTPDRVFSFDGEAFHPAVPASGSPIYFELVSQKRSRITALDPATGKLDDIAEGIEPAVSSDGSSVAFVSGDNLVLLRNGTRSIAATGQVSTPAFFPDGQRLAYTEGAPGRRVIRTADRTFTAEGDCFEPSVSPDGQSLAFACSDSGGAQIFTMNLASGVRRRLTSGACNSTWPAWTRDSRSIVFASDCNRGFGLPALYRIPAN